MEVTPSVLFFRDAVYSVGAIQFDLLLEEHHELKSTVSTHPIEQGMPVSDGIVPEPRSGSLKGFISNFSLTETRSLREVAPNVQALLGNKLTRLAGFGAGVAGGLVGGAASDLPGKARIAGAVAMGVAIAAAEQLALKPTRGTFHAALAASGVDRPKNRAKDVWELLKQLQADRRLVTIVTGLEKYENVAVSNVQTMRNAESGEALEFDLQFVEVRTVKLGLTTIQAKVEPKLTTKTGQQGASTANMHKTTTKAKPGRDKAALTKGLHMGKMSFQSEITAE